MNTAYVAGRWFYILVFLVLLLIVWELSNIQETISGLKYNNFNQTEDMKYDLDAIQKNTLYR